MNNYSDIYQVPISLPLLWEGAEDWPCTFYDTANSAYMEKWSNPVDLPWTGDRYDIIKPDDTCGYFAHISNAFRADKSCVDLFWDRWNTKRPSDAFNNIRNK